MKLSLVLSALLASHWVMAAEKTARKPSAQATLRCFNTYTKKGTPPFLTADVLEGGSLSNVKINDPNAITKAPPGEIDPILIQSNHSPYKGNNQYNLSDGAELVLPVSLDNDTLQSVFPAGLGYQKSENGVIFGSAGDGDGGSHYSVRLHCFTN